MVRSLLVDRTARPSLPPGVAVKLAQLEPMVAGSHWRRVREAIEPHLEDENGLPPELALLYALASHELGDDEVDGIRLAIDAMAVLVGAPCESPITVLLAKRLLRRGRPGIGRRPAPRWPLSLLIAVLGIALGAAVGWLVTILMF